MKRGSSNVILGGSMTDPAVLDIALLCNEKYVPGALQVLASVSTRAQPETRLRFDVFTEDVSESSVDQMRRLLARLHPASELRHQACDGALLEGLPPWAGSRVAALRCLYARLLPDVDWCLHLDCDILCLAGVEELFSQRDENYSICAVQEEDERVNASERDWISRHVRVDGRRLQIDASRYFNSGSMLMNLRKMREDGATERLLAFFREHPDVPSPDQDALNVVLGGQVKLLPRRFNQSQLTLTDVKLDERPVIHYVTGLPWSSRLMGVANNRFWLWHRFADRHVWGRPGESVRRCMSRRALALKVICRWILVLPVVGALFARSLQLLGRVREGASWRQTQVGMDLSRGAVERLMAREGRPGEPEGRRETR